MITPNSLRKERPDTQCYEIPDGTGGTLRVRLTGLPTPGLIKDLQELAALVRRRADDGSGVSPTFRNLLQRRRHS